jgi:hypothetical protein
VKGEGWGGGEIVRGEGWVRVEVQSARTEYARVRAIGL